tara:strand:- start:1594 stop:2001 length:408 start_codon:yes stop_codon:yes gene_type:complete
MTWKKSLLTRLALLMIPIAIVAGVSGCGGAKTILQSVVVRDTIVLTKERILHDTLTIQKDTILYQDRVKFEIKYLPGEKMMIKAECPSDTIRIETIRIVNQPIQKRGMGWEGLLGWIVVVLALLVIIKQMVKGLI